MKKTKNPSKKKNNTTARSRKIRSLKQKSLFIIKILFVMTIFYSIGLIYMNMNNIANKWYEITLDLGFTLKNITIEGQKYTSNVQIANQLKIKKDTPIFKVSLESIKNRLEQLEWVKYAIVERNLPDSIHISIVERTPIALGQKDRKLYIIDDEGVIIKENNLSDHLHLPIMIGDGSEIYAKSLISILQEDPKLFKEINSIIRVSERRWNIRFNNDVEVKLPEKNIEKAWKKVIKLYRNNELFLPHISSIDLRIANKIYVEKK